ncbi:MAG: hypothetical protein ABJE66_11740 [Deltaproteobacteria bacterium]
MSLRGLYLTCVLALAIPAIRPAIAWGQSVQQTQAAQQKVRSDEQNVGRLATQRSTVAQRYQDQLAAVDGLKKQKPSWRRDRELRQTLADSADTANQLSALNTQLAGAARALVQARGELVVAIDREKPTATGPRAGELAKLRAEVTATIGPAPKKIVLPDAEVDPLADPEELDQQAQAIAETEKQLANQVAGLDAQAGELAHVADLRKHNERAKDLMLAEDDQPHRNVQHSSGDRGAADSATPTNGIGGGAGQGTGQGGSTSTGGGGDGGNFNNNNSSNSFETEATFVLGEVIDRTTIDGLTRAQRSGDPAKRAEAARSARDAVSQRLEQLKKKRAQIEARAKQLRMTKH